MNLHTYFEGGIEPSIGKGEGDEVDMEASPKVALGFDIHLVKPV